MLGPYALGPNATPENGIYCGDSRLLAQTLPNDSIDLIFCDPVYQNIDDYAWLARLAARVLKPDSACLAWVSKVTLPECQHALTDGGLIYQTTLFYTVVAKQARPIFPYGIIPWTTPCLVFAKGRYKCQPFIPDTYRGSKPSQNNFKWQKNTDVIAYWLNAFSKPDQIVLDPFTGTGPVPAACKTLGRCYIAFEQDASRVAIARERVQNTPFPLFIPEPTQTRLNL